MALKPKKVEPRLAPVAAELDFMSVCGRNVAPLDSDVEQLCEDPVFWDLGGDEYCYKCGLDVMIAAFRTSGRAFVPRILGESSGGAET